MSDVSQEMTLKIYDDIAMVCHTQTMKYGGLLDYDTGRALTALSRNYSITFKVSLNEEASALKKRISNNCHSLQITLYGLRQDSDAIGTLLSKNKLYLQQPSTFDSSAVYFNPQYLLRPGSEFKLAVKEGFPHSVREKQIAQAVRSSMLRIFDAAVGPATFSEVQVSKRLTTDLKLYTSRKTPSSPFSLLSLLTFSRYQRKALAMMVEKESGDIENPAFPSLWVPKGQKGGSKKSVYVFHCRSSTMLTYVVYSGTTTL
jgi:SWI/SNF-related matrix-associated actin-dependent regulator of chromatin subfamily A3